MSVTEDYDAAAAKLMNYIALEPDPAKREKAQQTLSALNAKQQEQGFDNLSQQSAHLTALAAQLQSLVNSISTGSPVTGAISSIKDFVTDIKRKAEGGL